MLPSKLFISLIFSQIKGYLIFKINIFFLLINYKMSGSNHGQSHAKWVSKQFLTKLGSHKCPEHAKWTCFFVLFFDKVKFI